VLQQQAIQSPATAVGDSAREATRQGITDVGRGVAEARSTHELLRRAVFNSSDAQVIEKARQMQQRCRELGTIVQSATGRLCRSCYPAVAQRAIDAYRTGLPAVGRVGTRCVNQLTQDLRARLRIVGEALTGGLQPYEARLLDVRRVFGLVGPQAAPAPRR
jgi:carotenoid cleavage dioxygenase-like enzyme